MHCSTKSCRISPFNADLGKRRGNAAAVAACLPLPLHPSPKCAAVIAAAQAQYPRRKRQLLHPRGPPHLTSPLASCHWHYRTRRRDRRAGAWLRWGCSRGIGRRGPTSRAASCGLRPCTVMADAMRPVRGVFIPPTPPPTGTGETLALPYGNPFNHPRDG